MIIRIIHTNIRSWRILVIINVQNHHNQPEFSPSLAALNHTESFPWHSRPSLIKTQCLKASHIINWKSLLPYFNRSSAHPKDVIGIFKPIMENWTSSIYRKPSPPPPPFNIILLCLTSHKNALMRFETSTLQILCQEESPLSAWALATKPYAVVTTSGEFMVSRMWTWKQGRNLGGLLGLGGFPLGVRTTFLRQNIIIIIRYHTLDETKTKNKTRRKNNKSITEIRVNNFFPKNHYKICHNRKIKKSINQKDKWYSWCNKQRTQFSKIWNIRNKARKWEHSESDDDINVKMKVSFRFFNRKIVPLSWFW